MATVFISHAAKEDGQFAHRLADDLQRIGVQVWIAPESIRPSEDWVDAIERGLRESSHVVVVLTPAARESRWVKKETNVAIALERKGRIQVIPLVLEPCEVPLLLSTYQMVSFRLDYEAGLSQLADILEVRVPPPEPVRPPVTMPEAVRPTVMERVQPFEPEMVLIPAGEFLYGKKKKKVILPEFWIDKTPVTNAEYARFVADTGHKPPKHWKGKTTPKSITDHPVTYVSWHEAVAYGEWAGKRLPTEEEWEKAARGSNGREYPWGNGFDPNRCNTVESGVGKTTPVGQHSPQGDSPYGCVDMAGNVWEWTASDYDYNSKVLRGGSWFGNRRGAICSCRGRDDPRDGYDDVGFRCARGSL
jgi:formylglycine-generating enzyme required for sulfatase activity